MQRMPGRKYFFTVAGRGGTASVATSPMAMKSVDGGIGLMQKAKSRANRFCPVASKGGAGFRSQLETMPSAEANAQKCRMMQASSRLTAQPSGISP